MDSTTIPGGKGLRDLGMRDGHFTVERFCPASFQKP